MKARAITLAAATILVAAALSLGAPSTNPPVATGPQSLPGFGGSAGAHEFFLQPGSSWKGDLIIGTGVTYSLVILDIDATGLTALDGQYIYFNLQDAETGSSWQNLGVDVYMNFSGAGGGTLFQCYQTWTGEGQSSHGLSPGVLTVSDFDLRFDFTRSAVGSSWTVTPYFRLSAGTWTPFVGGSFVGTVPLDFTGGKLIVGFDGGMDGTLVFGNYYLQGPPSDVYVDDDWTGLSTGDPVQFPGQSEYRTFDVDAFAAIQDGIDNVVGSTVNVAAGTYTQNVVINQSVTMNGAQAGVDARGRVATESIITVASGHAVDIKASDVVVDGFEITGSASAQQLMRADSHGDGLEVRNCIFGGTAKRAFWFNTTASDVVIEYNEVVGTSFTDSYSLAHFDGSDVFDNLTISDNDFYDGGIFAGNKVYNSSNMEMSGNLFDNAYLNLSSQFQNSLIDNNTFQNNGYTHAQVGLKSSTISNNTFYNAGPSPYAGYPSHALMLWGNQYGLTPSEDVTVEHNTFHYNGTSSPDEIAHGLRVLEGIDATTVDVNENNFLDAGSQAGAYGVRNQGTGTLEASCNWWGDASGPTYIYNPGATGGEFEGSLTWFPWLTGNYPGGACDGYPPDNIAVDPSSVRCLSTNLPCDTVDVVFDRDDTTPVRGFSVTFELSPELALCGSLLGSIREGTYLNGVGLTHFEVTDNGGGSYTADCAILGLPCGATGNGVLFTIDVQGSGGDDIGSITVTSVTVRDCSNAAVVAFPGAPVDVTIDHTAPVAVVDLDAAQVKTGNGTGDTTGVTITFGAPVDASLVEVYRAGYGDYPEYDDGTGAEPAAPVGYPPGAPWTLTSVTSSGQVDWPPYRDYWYYVVYTRDDCGNVSLVSNKTTGTLNYHLGDVTDGVTTGHGDNIVNSLDISLLGANYWSTLIHNDPVNYLDVGPTADYTVDALPTTDNEVQFEDLMMFAINFGQVSLLAEASPRVMEVPDLKLVVEDISGDILTARLVLDGNRSSVKGLHAEIVTGTGLELLSMSKGGLWKGQAGPAFLEHLEDGGVVQVDGAVLGRGISLRGSGPVCELRFRVVGEAAETPRLAVADLRDLDNGRMLNASRRRDTGEADSRASIEFGARPNPFRGGATLHFAIPAAARVTLKVYDVSGRLVTTLVDENLSAGRHRVEWESADVSPGVYMAILQAGSERETRKLTLLP